MIERGETADKRRNSHEFRYLDSRSEVRENFGGRCLTVI